MRDLIPIWIFSGETRGRYTALQTKPDRRTDCYLATLIIGRVTPSDSKRYVLVAKNNRGTLRYPAVVRVRVFCLSWMNSKCHLSSFPDSGSDRHDDCNRPGHRPSPPRLHSVFRAGLRLQTRKGLLQRTEAKVGKRPDSLPSVRSQEVTAEHGNFDLYGKESDRTIELN